MRPLSIFVFSLFYFVTSSASTSSAPSSFPSLLFNLEPAFTATIKVSGRSPSVTVFGGELVNEPISGGTVVGPLVNATIEGGFAHPSIYKDESETGNVTVQAPVIDIYGKTDDGEAYYLHAAGLGSETGQVVRIDFDVSGKKYAALRDTFVLASITPSKNRTTVVVEGFLVSNVH